jgi:hypothetical protein
MLRARRQRRDEQSEYDKGRHAKPPVMPHLRKLFACYFGGLGSSMRRL